MGRQSYIAKASEDLEQAIEALGEVRASGDQLPALDRVYEQLIAVRQRLVDAAEAAA